MRRSPFEEQIRALLPNVCDAQGDPRPLSIAALCREIGIGRDALYARFRKPPWERGGRKWTEGKLISRIATVLQEVQDHLLWLAGYNPLVTQGLSRRELHLLYEIMLKLVYAVKGGYFDGDLKRLAGLPCSELQRLSKERGGTKCESS